MAIIRYSSTTTTNSEDGFPKQTTTTLSFPGLPALLGVAFFFACGVVSGIGTTGTRREILGVASGIFVGGKTRMILLKSQKGFMFCLVCSVWRVYSRRPSGIKAMVRHKNNQEYTSR